MTLPYNRCSTIRKPFGKFQFAEQPEPRKVNVVAQVHNTKILDMEEKLCYNKGISASHLEGV